ncbi:MAG: four-carbon acid sugar kinase family protein [Chloroflexota bacterium]
MKKSLNKANTFAALPFEWPESLLPTIQQQLKANQQKLVVLDDDPTGTQTVYDIPVLTEWSIETLQAEFLNTASNTFYILTNSRSVPSAEAQALNRDIGQNLIMAAQQAKKEFAVVSRSDSTLRGHFPEEVDALVDALAQPIDAWLIIPYFLEGGRYTLNDVHYVAEGEALVPAAETPFAQDAAFGYQASNLRQWVAEKTANRFPAETVASISIEDIRQGGPARVARNLMDLGHGSICVINAVGPRDMEVFVQGLLEAEAQGKRFLYRTAASFVQTRAGLAPRPLLEAKDINLSQEGGGLIVVGSYVPKTTTQVEALLASDKTTPFEIDVEALLDKTRRLGEINRIVTDATEALTRNEDVTLYTSRKLISSDDAAQSLMIGQTISDGLISIIQQISTQPRYLIAKGGITSSDVATKGLNVRRAMVRGQILPGIPLWELGPESRYPGIPYIVFPGNVGDSDALIQVVNKLGSS